MNGIQVMEFQKEYTTVNLEMQKEDQREYEYAILILYTLETDKGFKVKKIGKTTRKGTKVTYEAFKSETDSLDYKKLLEQKVKEFNDKWNAKLKIS